MDEWGFAYKTMLIWHKVRKDGGSDRRGVHRRPGPSHELSCSASATMMPSGPRT